MTEYLITVEALEDRIIAALSECHKIGALRECSVFNGPTETIVQVQGIVPVSQLAQHIFGGLKGAPVFRAGPPPGLYVEPLPDGPGGYMLRDARP